MLGPSGCPSIFCLPCFGILIFAHLPGALPCLYNVVSLFGIEHSMRLLIVEDHEVTRDGICLAISREAELEIVGTADNSDAALALARELRPDVILLDLHLPGSLGPKSMVQAFCEIPDCRIVVFSNEHRQAFIDVVMKLGAAAYLLKSEPSRVVIETIRGVCSKDTNPVSPLAARPSTIKLTEAERQLLELFAHGLKYQDIADKRFTTQSTVRKQCDLLLEKLGLENREALIAWAAKNGYGSLDREEGK